MRALPLILGAAVACLAGAALLGGAAPFGRLAMAAGLPSLAADAFEDAGWRGAALYRSGDYEAAATAYRGVPSEAYNRGTALAQAGEYAAALEALDLAMALDPGDKAAKANFDLIADFYATTLISPDAPMAWANPKKDGDIVAAPLGEGSGRAAGGGDEATNTGSNLGLPELLTRDKLGVRKVFDDRSIKAGPRWLATLADVPGEYLAQRILEEHKRRKALGLSPPEPETPE